MDVRYDTTILIYTAQKATWPIRGGILLCGCGSLASLCVCLTMADCDLTQVKKMNAPSEEEPVEKMVVEGVKMKKTKKEGRVW